MKTITKRGKRIFLFNIVYMAIMLLLLLSIVRRDFWTPQMFPPEIWWVLGAIYVGSIIAIMVMVKEKLPHFLAGTIVFFSIGFIITDHFPKLASKLLMVVSYHIDLSSYGVLAAMFVFSLYAGIFYKRKFED